MLGSVLRTGRVATCAASAASAAVVTRGMSTSTYQARLRGPPRGPLPRARTFDNNQAVDAERGVAVMARNNARIVSFSKGPAGGALKPAIIKDLREHFKRWSVDPNVTAVVVSGADGAAFSTGYPLEQLLAMAREGKKPQALLRSYFSLVQEIHKFQNHYLSVVDGPCVRGAFGLAFSGRWSLATERAVLAADEVRFGLAVSGGASHALARLPHGLGAYLALTGRRLRGRSLLHSRVATHFVHSRSVETLIDELGGVTPEVATSEHVNDLLLGFVDDVGAQAWLENEASADGDAYRRAAMDRTLAGDDQAGPGASLESCFVGAPSAEAVLERLHAAGTPWATRVARSMERNSPLAVKVTFALLQAAAKGTFDEALTLEFRAAARLVERKDFALGVEDSARHPMAFARVPESMPVPSWEFGSLAAVPDALVAEILGTKLADEPSWIDAAQSDAPKA